MWCLYDVEEAPTACGWVDGCHLQNPLISGFISAEAKLSGMEESSLPKGSFSHKEKLMSLAFTSFGHFSNDFTILLFSLLIVYYSQDYGISLAVLGAVAIIYNVLSGLLSTPIGSYADRTGQYRTLIAIGIAIIGIAVILFALSFQFSHYVLPSCEGGLPTHLVKGGKFSIIVTTVLSTIFFILFMLSGSNAILDTITYASFVFIGFTGFPVLLGYVSQIVPKKVATKSNGLVWGLGNTVGGGVGLAIMSIVLFLKITLVDTMWIMVIFGIVSCILLPLLPRKAKS